MPGERWKTIPFWEAYEVSSIGRVRSVDRRHFCARGRGYWVNRKGVMLKLQTGERGHQFVTLQDRGYVRRIGVHALVLEAFVGPAKPGEEGCHDNGKSWDNRLENLRWGTRQDNHDDMTRHGTRVRGSRVGTAKLTEPQVIEIKKQIEAGEKQRDVAKRFGVCKSTIGNIARDEYWRHIS